MKSALIPAGDGGRVIAWTCRGGDGCKGGCSRVYRSEGRGDPETVALEHTKTHGMEPIRVHTVNSGGRGRTFKVWHGPKGYEAREVL